MERIYGLPPYHFVNPNGRTAVVLQIWGFPVSSGDMWTWTVCYN